MIVQSIPYNKLSLPITLGSCHLAPSLLTYLSKTVELCSIENKIVGNQSGIAARHSLNVASDAKA